MISLNRKVRTVLFSLINVYSHIFIVETNKTNLINYKRVNTIGRRRAENKRVNTIVRGLRIREFTTKLECGGGGE